MTTPNKIDEINTALKQIEEALQITIEEENDEKQQENFYKSYHHRFIDNLTLSNLEFQDFEDLTPVFKLVTSLKLINCTVNNIASLVNLEYVNDLILENVILPNIYQPDAQIVDTIGIHFRTVEYGDYSSKYFTAYFEKLTVPWFHKM